MLITTADRAVVEVEADVDRVRVVPLTDHRRWRWTADEARRMAAALIVAAETIEARAASRKAG